MNILQDAKQAFPEMGLLNLNENYSNMEYHKQIFQNFPNWKRTKASGLYAKGNRNRKLLNTAKVICDEFAAMTFSEQVEITIDNEQYQDYICETLNKTGFWRKFPEILSYAYAMGGCALKVYADDSKPAVDYVQAVNFLPTGWIGDTITECIFRTTSYKNGNYYTLLEHHSINNDGYITIDNAAFKSGLKNSLGAKCAVSEMFPKLTESIIYSGINVPMFSYFKPCVSNNTETDSPLGLSIFANAIDTLEALDIAFDSFSREFILGKKRIIVPAQCIRTVVDPITTEMRQYFDADDEAFIALNAGENDVLKVIDNTVELRIDEHVSAINALLNILCFQIGLSAGSLSFDAIQGMKTATEVISQDSKTARTIKSNKNLLSETIEQLIHSLIAIGTALKLIPVKKYTVTVGWQDNIIIDDNTLIDNNIKLTQAGLKSKVKAIMDVLKCDEETAQEELDRINKEQSVTGLSVDDFMGGENEGGEAVDEAGNDESEPGAE